MQIRDSGEASNRLGVLRDYRVSHRASDVSMYAVWQLTMIPQYLDFQQQGISFTLFLNPASVISADAFFSASCQCEEIIRFYQVRSFL